ncbi:mannan-binding protein [Cystobacter fuscus]|uniref:mannan-binding protein n=1 Tax=Cystobacter fuscus TaxID=43 RepID=UPI002B304C8B|nr:hypothetical protein F0U63_24770 [Cystobacter fuscus]
MKRRFGALSLAVSAALVLGQRAEASSHDVETELLRDGPDAQDKCPSTCSTQNEYWTGQWRTALPEKASSCQCAQPPFEHLVIDAGSSGTRLLLYEVARGPQGCQLTPPKAQEQKKDSTLGALADMDVKMAEQELGERITALAPTRVVLLGTGGFRQKGMQGERKMRELRERLARHVQQVEIISGKTEGELAWLATQPTAEKAPFSILEIGGVSVQFATGEPSGDIQSVSDDAVGINVLSEEMGKDKANCLKEEESFTRCMAAIGQRLESSQLARKTSKLLPEGQHRPVYIIGKELDALFQPGKELSRALLEGIGKKWCKDSRTGDDKAKASCFKMAYLSALLKAVKAGSIRKGADSWTRAAAVNADYFPNCR